MATLKTAIKNIKTTTTNGMKARVSTGADNVDLFYKIAALRGQDILPLFQAALVENSDYALRIALWSRDIREGAGERQTFRNILNFLEVNAPEELRKIMHLIPELGRWDDGLVFKTEEFKHAYFEMIKVALLVSGDGLCAKWLPRQKSSKSKIANELIAYLELTPKAYRKLLVTLTKVVETQMCAKDWDNINFSHVPSVASARYMKAFGRNTPKYGEYIKSLVKGDDPKVKVNASAIFPHDIIKGRLPGYGKIFSAEELQFIGKQWEALPNYVGESSVLALVDTSGSMTSRVGNGSSSLTCLEVACSLGLYVADKNKGAFKDLFMTFSERPKLLHLQGDINQKMAQMTNASWGYSTNLDAALFLLLETAKTGNVPESEMPKILLILSDMQFNQCIKNPESSANKMIKDSYKNAGYEVPKIVFWNLNSHDNVPAKYNKEGVALVSGFSPSILKAILAGNEDKFTPKSVMLDTIMKDRYNY
jgi:hypothetical protein